MLLATAAVVGGGGWVREALAAAPIQLPNISIPVDIFGNHSIATFNLSSVTCPLGLSLGQVVGQAATEPLSAQFGLVGLGTRCNGTWSEVAWVKKRESGGHLGIVISANATIDVQLEAA